MSDPDDSKPTVGPSFKTGKRGEKIFADWIPDDWIPRKQDPDFFVDYFVEIVEKGEPTGRQFAAQIKGIKLGKNCATPLKYSAEGKHVRYWLHKCQHPVFVFLIDTEKRSGHWVFAQKFAHEQITMAALEKQKTFTLRFFAEDNLANKEWFVAALQDAEKYVRDLHPGSVQAALVKKRQELEKKEPRLAYKIAATEGAQTIHISAKEPFQLKVEVLKEHAAEAVRAFTQALEGGLEIKLPLNKIRLTGSPLFEDFGGSAGQMVIKFGQDVPGQLILSRVGIAAPKVLFVDGIYRIGTKVATFQSSLADAPLTVRCTFGPAPEPENMSIGLEFVYSPQRWQGQPVLHLPYFEAILDVLAGMVSESGIHTEFVVRGVCIAKGSHRELNSPETLRLFNFVSWLHRCRNVALKYGVNPCLPNFDTVTNEQWEMVDDLEVLLSGNKRVLSMPKLSAHCTLSVTPGTEVKAPMFGCVRLDNKKPDLKLFGVPVAAGPLRIIFTSVNVAPISIDRDRRQLLEIKGTDSTLRILEPY